MTQPDLHTTVLSERLCASIDASIAAEAACKDLVEGITVEDAEFCLGVVSTQLLEIRASQHQTSFSYDENQAIFETHTRELQGVLTQRFVNLLIDRELSNGATAQEAEAAADAHTRTLFDEYLQKREVIDSAND